MSRPCSHDPNPIAPEPLLAKSRFHLLVHPPSHMLSKVTPSCCLPFVLKSRAGRCPLQLQVWKATVYLTPLLGAYLADALMGRFWVILVFSCIYFVVSETQ